MGQKVGYWLRWLAVIPGGLLVGIFATFPLHWLLSFIFAYGEGESPLSLLLWAKHFGATAASAEYLLSPAVIATFFVYSGSKIAPKENLKTAKVLFGIYVTIWLIVSIIALSGQNVAGGVLTFSARTILAPLGALLGLISAKAKNDKPLEEKAVYKE